MNKYKIMKIISQFFFVIIIFVLLFLALIRFNIITLDSSELPLAIVLNNNEIGLKLGDDYQLEASVYPKNVYYDQVKWTSSDPNVATVNEITGYIETHKVGTAVIKANVLLNNLETECIINVSKNDILVKNIEINNSEINLLKGDSYKLSYSLSPSNATTHNFDYISSDTSIVIVNEKGVIKAVNSGRAIVTIKSRINNVSDSVVINVYNYSTQIGVNNESYVNNELNTRTKNLSLSSVFVELGVGIKSKLTSVVMPVNASQMVNWISTNTNVVMVSKDGNIVGVNEGTAKIIATTVDGVSSICEVVVSQKNNKKESISILEDNIEMEVGEKKNINYTLYLSNVNSSTLKWSSSNEIILTVDNGVITALSTGEAIVEVTADNGKYNDAVKVKVNNVSDVIKLESIMFSNNLLNAKVNDTINLIPNVSPINANNYLIEWFTSDKNIAIVDNGVVKCLKEGNVTITAKSNDISANVDIIIGNVYPSLITIEGDDFVNLAVNETKYLIKKIIPSNSTNQNVTWLSSNNSIVSINKDGLIKGIKKGNAIITVKTTNDKSYSINVIVS